MNITLDNLVLANGRVIIEKTEHRGICKVTKVAQNTNYEGLKKKIDVGSLILCSEHIYSSVKIEDKYYYLIKPSEIYGIFD